MHRARAFIEQVIGSFLKDSGRLYLYAVMWFSIHHLSYAEGKLEGGVKGHKRH